MKDVMNSLLSVAWRGGLILLAAAVLAAGAQAATVRHVYQFETPQVEMLGGYHSVSMAGAWSFGAPGEPVLPMTGGQILLPPGEMLTSIEIIPGEKIALPGSHAVQPGQPQVPLSFTGPIPFADPNPAIYGNDAPYPGRLNDEAYVGLFRGYRIASFALHPVEYQPASGTLSYYRSFEVVLTTAPSGPAMDETARMIRHDETTLARLAGIVDNPDDAAAYSSITHLRSDSRLDPALAYTYLIVTGDGWASYVQPLATFETQRGHKAGVFTKSWILANYTGQDEQWKIRSFIIDAYQTWGVDYVLLVGDARDTAGIPDRGFYAVGYGSPDSDIPADMYYGCLDGNWNTDGDGYWGEQGEDDLYFEVGVGRACGDSQAELENFVTKSMRYVNAPIGNESDEALMAGELLWTSPLTYGDDYKEQVRLGSSADGYTTVGFPATMNVGTLYDRPGTWTKAQLIALMENGMNIVNHLGHCNVTYAMRMDNPDIQSFDNDGTVHSYNFVYSQGCYCGSMDNRNDGGGYTDDCFAEQFNCDDDGAVSIIMNSRYGWGDPGGTNGSSQYFDREFFDAIFGERIYPVSNVNDDSKMDTIWALAYGANRWCYYELNLFGDPAMHLWTAVPGQLAVTTSDVVLIGVPEFQASVRTLGGAPVAGAQVTAYTDDFSVYATGVTNAFGDVTLMLETEEPGTLRVKATAHDFLAWNGDVPIIPPAGPYMVVGDRVIGDDIGDESNGNNDGGADAGEALELVLGLRNVGIETALNVRATLSTEDAYVEIADGFEMYGDVAPGEQCFCQDDFVFQVSPTCPDAHAIQFSVSIESDNRMIWDKDFVMMVDAPVVRLVSFSIDDAAGGNGNGHADPGETFFMQPLLANDGAEDATNLSLQLHVSSSHVTILQGTATLPLLAAGGQGSPSPAFQLSIDAGCPDPDLLAANIVVNADWGQNALLEFSLPIGGLWDNMESGTGTWTHYVVSSGFVDQWHRSNTRNYTPGGAYSWKFGDTGTGDYASLADGALESEPVTLRETCYLRFRHWMEAETSGSYPGYCYDGGIVEMSIDGGAWTQIAPVGGYPYRIRTGSTPGPFPAETPVFSGNINWAEAVFEIFGYSGEARFRFRFGSDGADVMEGWYVDDVEYSGTGTDPSDAGGWTPLVLHPAIDQNHPNPFGVTTVIAYRLPEKSAVRLQVFDTGGRLVRTLLDGPCDAGVHFVNWDGRDERGAAVSSGVYFYSFETNGVKETRKLILAR